jgi:hypothetical protein
MKGTILDFSIQTNTGIVSGDDGKRYSFAGAEWKDSAHPAKGMTVDFEPKENLATGVYGSVSTISQKKETGVKKTNGGTFLVFGIGFILIGVVRLVTGISSGDPTTTFVAHLGIGIILIAIGVYRMSRKSDSQP